MHHYKVTGLHWKFKFISCRREREKRGDTIYEVRGEITLVFSLLMEHDVKNVLSAVSLTAISRQPRETGGSLEEWWNILDSTICCGVNIFTLLRISWVFWYAVGLKSMLDNDRRRGSYFNWASTLGAEIKDFLMLSFQFDLHVPTATVAAWFKARDWKCLIVGSVKERRLHFIFRNDVCQINTQVLTVVIMCVCFTFPGLKGQVGELWNYRQSGALCGFHSEIL